MINNRQNNRRRGRGGGPRPNGANPGNDRGNRIDNRARGNASQLHEKYKTLARDAQMQGDRVMSEYYFQFADHYFRVLSENRPRFEEQNRGRPDQSDRDYQDDYADEGDGQADAVAAPYGNRESYGNREAPQRRVQPPVETAPMAVEAEEARAPYANGHAAVVAEAVEDVVEEPVRASRGRRGRPRKETAAPDLLAGVEQQEAEQARIEIDRLPPAFASEAEPAEEKPKRRGRRPRAESAPAEA